MKNQMMFKYKGKNYYGKQVGDGVEKLINDKVIEIGSGWMGLDFSHKYYFTATNLLLLTYLFEHLGFNRVQWKTDVINVISQKAAISIGYKREGILRSYVLGVNGDGRDVVMFSMVKNEWSEVKLRLEHKIAEKLQSH